MSKFFINIKDDNKLVLGDIKDVLKNFEMSFDVTKIEKMGDMSDGYHSFNELYYHRMMLFSVICNTYKDIAWKSWKHDDETMYDDYFIVGIDTEEGQYTYHYHKDYWDNFKVKELEYAPIWDGAKKALFKIYSNNKEFRKLMTIYNRTKKKRTKKKYYNKMIRFITKSLKQ